MFGVSYEGLRVKVVEVEATGKEVRWWAILDSNTGKGEGE
jgi:hypothetical protein